MIATPEVLEQFQAPIRLRALGGAYLASNSMGIIPRSAIQAELECLELENQSGIEVWDGGAWLRVLDRYAAVIARYMEVDPRQICPVTNITDGLWRVLSCFDPRQSNRPILHTAMEFTTQLYADHGFEKFGAEVVTVESDPQHHTVPTERLVSAIKRHWPAIVNLSHAAFESAYLHDVQAIAEACRSVEALFVLDAAQTGFVLPFTLEQTGADVILLQQHKWGCAGTGGACLVASDRFARDFTPALLGWMSHADTFAFERGAARLPDTAARFQGGTPEVPAKARAAAAAEIIINTLGIEQVAAHNRALVGRLLEGLDQAGLPAIKVPRRTGFVAVECGTPARKVAIEQALRQEHFVIDGRGSRLRIGPTFYNDEGDIDRFVAALGRLWRQIEG